MAAPDVAHLSLASTRETTFSEADQVKRRRRISPQTGRALEILGHAIDYLADQYVFRYGPFPPEQGDVQAWELLKTLNRQIYLACPAIPTWRERLRSLLHLH